MTEAWVQSLFDEEPEVYGPKERQRKDGERSGTGPKHQTAGEGDGHIWWERTLINHPLGAPPLDWWNIEREDAILRLVKAMCPERVCRTCGEPSRRIVGDAAYVPSASYRGGHTDLSESNRVLDGEGHINQFVVNGAGRASVVRQAPTLGWTDCGHDDWRPGVVLDPFAQTEADSV